MTISRVGSSDSIHLFSDEEVDEKGNLKGFVVDDEEDEDGVGISSESKERRHVTEKRRRFKRLKRKADGDPPKVSAMCTRSKKPRISESGSEDDDSSFEPGYRPRIIQGRCFKELYSSLDAIHPEEIIGRDDEARRILSMIIQPGGGVRPLLLGPAGIGKCSIVKKVAQVLKLQLKGLPLGNRRIFRLDCNELLADSVAENVTEVVGDKLRDIIDRTYRSPGGHPIFYFRHIEKILHLDHVTEYLQSVLKRPYPFIASISDDAKSETVLKAENILRKYNFAVFSVEESPVRDVEAIVVQHLKKNRLHPNLVISEEAVNLGVRLALKYEHNQPFPVKAINLIQESANSILFRQQVTGKLQDRILITPKEIAEVVSLRTKVPAVDLMDDSIFNQERFIGRLKSRVVGQDYALKIVSDRVAIYKMKLADPKKPWGVFLFVGPTGVGKTELAKSLAQFLFEDESNLITINGSEYIEEHTVSNLIGSPKGYEGNESGGLLTEPLKKNPHQVVLLDEFEKAHINVQRLFLQVFDSGLLIDRKGDRVDCSPTLFIMTSNVGSSLLCEAAAKGGMSPEQVTQILIPHLKEEFSPELVGRFRRGIVPFQPLHRGLMPAVAEVKLNSIKERLEREAEIELSWTQELIRNFAESDVDVSFGMREFSNMIDETVVGIIKDAIIQSGRRITGRLELTYRKDQEQYFLKVSKK